MITRSNSLCALKASAPTKRSVTYNSTSSVSPSKNLKKKYKRNMDAISLQNNPSYESISSLNNDVNFSKIQNNDWKVVVKSHTWKLVSVIGHFRTGYVFHVMNKNGDVAVMKTSCFKSYRGKKPPKGAETHRELLKEKLFYTQHRNKTDVMSFHLAPNFIDYCDKVKSIGEAGAEVLILEKMNGSLADLLNIIKTRRAIPTSKLICTLAMRLFVTLHSFHTTLKRVHLDIKPGNILFNSLNQLRLCDFESVERPDQSNKSIVGSIRWQSVMAHRRTHNRNWYDDYESIVYILLALTNKDQAPPWNAAVLDYEKNNSRIELLDVIVRMKEDISLHIKWDAIESPIHHLIKSLYDYVSQQSKSDTRINVVKTPFLNLLKIKQLICDKARLCFEGEDILGIVEKCYDQDESIHFEVYTG